MLRIGGAYFVSAGIAVADAHRALHIRFIVRDLAQLLALRLVLLTAYSMLS